MIALTFSGIRPDAMKRTPLIILNGFLGAGKTTLLKNLL
ncbi:TPA: GTP-binding protein, partial [Klebsiella pneumoniae]